MFSSCPLATGLSQRLEPIKKSHWLDKDEVDIKNNRQFSASYLRSEPFSFAKGATVDRHP